MTNTETSGELFPNGKIVLSLCDYSGNWPRFYREAGYDVRTVDLKREGDVRWIKFIGARVHGILAAPPCTAFAGSGAQYWKAKDQDGRTLENLALVDACLRAVAIYRPAWWALENPVGRLRDWLGPPRLMFHPCDYGGYGDETDAYTKKTLIWGEFAAPPLRRVEPVKVCDQGSWVQKLGGKSERTKELRSVTPLGFARAFFGANP